jgi:hypothetical protein
MSGFYLKNQGTLGSAGENRANNLQVIGGQAGLYRFTSATFSPGGAIGQDGPNLSQAIAGLTGDGVDSWKNNTQFFNVENGIQLWTVPATGDYAIDCYGAQGGDASSNTGGLGARRYAVFSLTEGEILKILAGQQGETGGHSQNNSQFVAAGGGGSFVVKTTVGSPTTSDILIVAGGGGGAANNTWTVADGLPAVNTTNGASGQGGAVGGTSGGGGTGNQGGAGAGFLGNGATPSGTPASDASKSFINGSTGGRNGRSWGGPEIYGGFGGGGGGGGLAAGGGGGYSGGGAGTWSAVQAGGGGGSFVSSTAISTIDYPPETVGDGFVIITRM